MPTAFIYCRVSTAKQTSMGLDAQLQVGKAIWENHLRKEFPTLEVFSDEGVSAGEIEFLDRPKSKELSMRLKKGDVVILPKLDRGFRNIRDALNTMHHWDAIGVRMICGDFQFGGKPFFDSKDPMCMWGMIVAGYVAQLDIQRMSQRMKDFAASQKAAGRVVCGPPPYGFKKIRIGEPTGAKMLPPAYHVPEESERKMLMFIYRSKLRGFTFSQIIEHFHKNGLKYRERIWTMKHIMRAYRKYKVVLLAEKKYREDRKHALRPWEYISPYGVLCDHPELMHLKAEHFRKLREYEPKQPEGDDV